VTAFHFRVSLAPVTLALLLTFGPVQPRRCSSFQLLRSMRPCLEHPAPAPRPLINPLLGADPVLDYHRRLFQVICKRRRC